VGQPSADTSESRPDKNCGYTSEEVLKGIVDPDQSFTRDLTLSLKFKQLISLMQNQDYLLTRVLIGKFPSRKQGVLRISS